MRSSTGFLLPAVSTGAQDRQGARLLKVCLVIGSAIMEVGPEIVDYVAPPFTHRLDVIPPVKRLRMAMTPTPIQRFPLPACAEGFDVFVKRDDMTGSTLSGNKIRKLEFILADAIEKKADVLITCGGVQSNFCRTAALAAKELGMTTHLLLRSPSPGDPRSIGNQGNVLLHKLNGSIVHLIHKQAYLTGILPKMEQLADELRAQGAVPYLVPVGGSNALGLWGYFECWRELISQGATQAVDDVVVTVGSGGTAAGLAIGNYLSGSPVKVHAISVCDNAAYFHQHINEMLEAIGLSKETCSEDIINIIDGYKGRGYALNTEEEFEMFREISRSSGVPVDPVYTGKGVRGLLMEIQKQASSGSGPFQGRRILFVHTGGVFGLYDGQIEPYLDDADIRTWPE